MKSEIKAQSFFLCSKLFLQISEFCENLLVFKIMLKVFPQGRKVVKYCHVSTNNPPPHSDTQGSVCGSHGVC